MKKSHNLWLNAWYGNSIWVYCLLPLSWLYRFVSFLRKSYLIAFVQKKVSVPVVIVGNISVGGTGKTPLIISLIEYLQQQGHTPGVVSRGYGGVAPQYPYLLTETSTANESGDEPLLIFNATKCNVCVAPDRVAAAELLVTQGCTIILSDDGLQHYRLGRDIEIAVIDGLRLFGNEQCLPVGPLREPVSRLKTVDLIVVNNPQQEQPLSDQRSYAMNIVPAAWRQLRNQTIIPLQEFPDEKNIQAIAGIGNPQRFFNTLSELSLQFKPHEFADHQQFTPTDFDAFTNFPVVMTEKDAVKCQRFAKENWYSLIVGAHLSDGFWKVFQQKLDALRK